MHMDAKYIFPLNLLVFHLLKLHIQVIIQKWRFNDSQLGAVIHLSEMNGIADIEDIINFGFPIKENKRKKKKVND